MEQLECNISKLMGLFKWQNQSFPRGIRDLCGGLLALGVLLSWAAWKLPRVDDLLTCLLSLIILGVSGLTVLALPITQFVHRHEPRNDTLWARFHTENNQN